jgi:2,3-bisphosphoglycerate-dependent phosphoglycerate mutase
MLPSLPENPLLRIEQGGTEILLIRHGHAVPQADAIVSGSYDEQPLSELGRRQAHALATRLQTQRIVAVYSSPILRAHETATFVATACGTPLTTDNDLREVDLSAVRPVMADDMSPAERQQALQTYLQQSEAIALHVGVWSAIPGVESSLSVRSRMVAALTRIALQHPGQRIAVVSHNGAINAGIAAFLGIDRDFFFPAANTSISVIRLFEDRHLVVTINDQSHLFDLSTQEIPDPQNPSSRQAKRPFWRRGRLRRSSS